MNLFYRAWKDKNRIYSELRVGSLEDGIVLDGKAKELLKAVYLKPLRDAEREMSSGRNSKDWHKYCLDIHYLSTRNNIDLKIFF